MPSKSPSQKRLFAAAAHDPAFAKKVGVPQSVAKDFNAADAGKRPSNRGKVPGFNGKKRRTYTGS